MLEHRLTLMGDLTVEFSSRLADVQFSALEHDQLRYAPIMISVGGTAANLALAAIERFAAVNVLARVGDDAFGGLVLATLSGRGVRTLLPPSRIASTGLAMYLRDSAPGVEKGVRLLVIDRGANRLVDTTDVEEHMSTIRESDAFFVDGYCFLEEPRCAASQHAMQLAQEAGVFVALDLVPHDAHRFFRLRNVTRWFERADLVISEVRTIRRILGLASAEEVKDAEAAYDTWRVLDATVPGRAFQLRFGAGNVDQSLHCQPGQEPELRDNGYMGAAEPRGFGDRLSAADLADFLSRRVRARQKGRGSLGTR
jgi:sugar/nucleoside kinase (ribokinase family)